MEQYGKKFEELNFKEKLEFIREYYLWYIVATLIGVFVLGSFLFSAFSPKETYPVNALVAGAINYDESVEEVDTFYKENFQTDLSLSILDFENFGELENAMLQKISIMVQTRDLDIFAMSSEVFEVYASQRGTLAALDEIPELAGLLEKYEDRLVTWDQKFTDTNELVDVEEHVYGIKVSNFPNIPCITMDDDLIITVTGVVDDMPNTIETLEHILEGSK